LIVFIQVEAILLAALLHDADDRKFFPEVTVFHLIYGVTGKYLDNITFSMNF
jgi:hypothetical protein